MIMMVLTVWCRKMRCVLSVGWLVRSNVGKWKSPTVTCTSAQRQSWTQLSSESHALVGSCGAVSAKRFISTSLSQTQRRSTSRI